MVTTLGLGGALWSLWRNQSAPPRGIVQMDLDAFPDEVLDPVISPDGRWVAFFTHPDAEPSRLQFANVADHRNFEPALLGETMLMQCEGHLLRGGVEHRSAPLHLALGASG